jgi:LacI family transcriptional regulator
MTKGAAMAARVTIREVAVAADVAVGTVSHYLNHPDRVSDEKAERIRTAIENLGFVRNNAGRQLRLGTSSTIAYLTPDVSNPYFAEVAEAIEDRAAERGVALFIANAHREPAREQEYLDLFEQYQFRGLLVASHETIEDRLVQLRRRGTPAVLLGYNAAADQPSLSVDDIVGGHLAAEHLLSVGCERLCYVGGPLGLKQVADRLSGASDIVRRSGNATLEVIDTSHRTLEGGRAIGEELLRRDPSRRPDGIFAVNDIVALGIMQALVLGGVRVPDEVAIVGYDDIAFAEASLIPLTTIHTSHREFGIAAVDLLFEVIEGTVGERRRILTPELVARRSTDRAR